MKKTPTASLDKLKGPDLATLLHIREASMRDAVGGPLARRHACPDFRKRSLRRQQPINPRQQAMP